MRRILMGGLLAMMLLALFRAGFMDFLEPAAPPGPVSGREPAVVGAGPEPLPALPPADTPLPDSLPALEREGAQIREGLAQIDQARDRMLNGVLSVLRPYGEARAVNDAAARRLEALSALRRQSLDRLSRIEMRRAGIEAGGDSPPMAAALPPELPALPPDGTQPFRTAMVGPPPPGFSAVGDGAEVAPLPEAPSAASPLVASPESRAPAGAAGEAPASDELAPALAMQALPLPPPASPPVLPMERGAAKPPPRPLRAEPTSLRAAAANPARCRSIILRGQLGEGLSFADRSFLRGHCPG